jgi:adenine-specific DNA-methyltransferase
MSLEEYWEKTGKKLSFIRRNPNGKGKNSGVENWIAPTDEILCNTNWTDILAFRADESTQGLFDFPKNVDLIKLLLQAGSDKGSIILDAFSGSATTAQATMELNKEDNGHRQFIMIQLPELTDVDSDAYKAGYKNVCEIGEERIRRSGDKLQKSAASDMSLDTGFRVFNVDTSNMKDVYFAPKDFQQDKLELFLDNVKEDRSELDLLYSCIVGWGLSLTLPIRSKTVDNTTIYIVNDGDLELALVERLQMVSLVQLQRNSLFASSSETTVLLKMIGR